MYIQPCIDYGAHVQSMFKYPLASPGGQFRGGTEVNHGRQAKECATRNNFKTAEQILLKCNIKSTICDCASIAIRRLMC